jgi:hypothetical protein
MEDCRTDVAGALGDSESYKLVVYPCDTWRCEALRSLRKGTPSLCVSLPLHMNERTLHCWRWSKKGQDKINLDIYFYVLRNLHLLTKADESYGASFNWFCSSSSNTNEGAPGVPRRLSKMLSRMAPLNFNSASPQCFCKRSRI